MKILARDKIKPIHLTVGDTLAVTHTDETGETVLCQHSIDAGMAMTVDEAVLFSDQFEGRRALGGLIVEQKK